MPGAVIHLRGDLEEVAALEDMVAEEMVTILHLPMTHGPLRGPRRQRGHRLPARGQAHLGQDSRIKHGDPVFGLAQLPEPRPGMLQEGLGALNLLHHPSHDLDMEVDGLEVAMAHRTRL